MGGGTLGQPWAWWEAVMEEGISAAELEYRRRAADNQRCIAASADVVRQAELTVQDRVPDGWRAIARQHLDGALHTLDIQPAPTSVDAIAYLIPSTDGGGGWRVRVHNRTHRVDFPLYRDGGARAALFDTVCGALDAAIRALRVEIASTGHVRTDLTPPTVGKPDEGGAR